jgi:hypothetical protein
VQHALAIAVAATAAACSVGSSGSFPSLVTARPAQDVPERFVPADRSLLLTPGDTIAGDGCRSPMADPRDGATLIMQRAQAGYADYEVPGGRYGVGDGELLRLICNTGLVAGIVRR